MASKRLDDERENQCRSRIGTVKENMSARIQLLHASPGDPVNPGSCPPQTTPQSPSRRTGRREGAPLDLPSTIGLMRRVGASSFALVCVFGCANLTSISSGQIGCPPEEIRIMEEESGWVSRTWVAECRGRRFYCAEVSAGDSAQFDCAEETSAIDTSSEPGCQFDTQCRGDRICETGKCSSP
jgi:hypothetical protein